MSIAEQRLDDIAKDQRPVIALDLDDVLSSTNFVAAQWHNETYGTDMQLSDFYYYTWWQNPYWGTPDETIAKVKDLYKTGRPYHAPPIDGAGDGVRKLHELGYRLVIVTAREKHEMDDTRQWLHQYFGDLIDDVICTGMPLRSVDDDGKEISTKETKAEVCHRIDAVVLVDDAREHALTCSTATPPVRVLLFGSGEWNKRCSVIHGTRPKDVSSNDIQEGYSAGVDPSLMSFDERLRFAGGKPFWEQDAQAEDNQIPEHASVTRVEDWSAIVNWAEKYLRDSMTP